MEYLSFDFELHTPHHLTHSLNHLSSGIWNKTTLQLDASKQYQRIEGFGGAVTDAAAINWKSLSPVLRDYLVR